MHHKNLPIVGKVIGSTWEGDDLGAGIIERLNGDPILRDMIGVSSELTIRTHPDYQCWTIATEHKHKLRLPSDMDWSCYLSIAKHLLAE